MPLILNISPGFYCTQRYGCVLFVILVQPSHRISLDTPARSSPVVSAVEGLASLDNTCISPASQRNPVRDAGSFRLDENRIIESEEVRPGVILDFDENGQVVGVEFLGISKRATAEELSSIQFQTS